MCPFHSPVTIMSFPLPYFTRDYEPFPLLFLYNESFHLFSVLSLLVQNSSMMKKITVSSAEVIATNIDLLLLILICLPPRSLLIFRCVCKEWLSLISDLQFQKNHACRNPNPSISGLYYVRRPYCFINPLRIPLPCCGYHTLPPLAFLEQFVQAHCLGELREIYILHSFKGLLLCSVDFECGIETSKSVLIVCNPTTQRCKLLHPLDSFPWSFHVSAYLYFDPSKSTHYKVIFVGFDCSDDGSITYCDFAIYSSENEFWKTIYSVETSNIRAQGIVSSKGVIYSIIKDDDIQCIGSQFMIDTEKLSQFLLVKKSESFIPFKVEYFGENDGKLFFVIRYSDSELMFYEFVERGASLTSKQYFHSKFDCSFKVICATFGGESGRDLEYVLASSDKLVYYNHQSKAMEVLCDLPSDGWPPRKSRWEYPFPGVRHFYETLFPV